MIPEYNPYFMPLFVPFIPPISDKPPTLYSILESIVNGGNNEDEKKIKDLAKYGRQTIFDFDYPLSSNINKEEFECLILNHYLMRRIGFETVTAFRIALGAKLNEIMPMYNKMFDSFEDWNIFDNDSDITIRTGENTDETESKNLSNSKTETKSETSSNGTSKDSELPQSEISNIHNDSYLTNYGETENSGEDKSESTGESKGETSGKTKKIYQEKVERILSGDKIEIMKEMQNNIKSIYTMIFKDLDILFYGLL